MEQQHIKVQISFHILPINLFFRLDFLIFLKYLSILMV